MGRMQDKVVVITGGGSGIGRAAAIRFAAEGAAVAVGDLREDQAEQVAREARDAGGRAIGSTVDVLEEASLAALVEAAVSEFGRLDVMCNHVGGSDPRKDVDLLRMEMAEFDRTMALNVRSTVLGCRLALPHLIEGGSGSIINTASVGGLNGDFVQVAYGTAKAAVIRLTQYVATQYGADNVRCNAIAPGAVQTPALAKNLPAEMVEGIRSHNALPFLGEPDDIAHAMVFLGSEESRYLTGQVIVVDGGMTSQSPIAEIRRPGHTNSA